MTNKADKTHLVSCNQFGFLLPAKFIRQTALEVSEGVIYLAKFINTIEGVTD